VRTSCRCCIISSSTRNNRNEQYLEPAFYTLIENKYVSIYDNAYLINILGYIDVYVNTRNL
jgi:hypothetical protein